MDEICLHDSKTSIIRHNSGYQNRRTVEYVLKNYTLRSMNKILYYVTYYNAICTYIWTRRIGGGSKKMLSEHTLHTMR